MAMARHGPGGSDGSHDSHGPDATLDARQEQLAQLRRLQAEFGRIWQGMRERVDRPCAVCGTVMHGVVKNRRYCSEACKSAAYRQRLGAAYWERRRAQRQARQRPHADPPTEPEPAS
jgi:hypothetical protein